VDGAADFWKKYMQLTEVEAALRTLKSELAIQPLFHQLEKRVKAHVLVAFLGYALELTLKHLLKRSGSEYNSWRRSVVWTSRWRRVEGREIWLR
jgi:transposase